MRSRIKNSRGLTRIKRGYCHGYGFLEKVYQEAMQVELPQNGLQAELEQPIKIHFKGAIVGDYYADPFVAGKVIVSIRV